MFCYPMFHNNNWKILFNNDLWAYFTDVQPHLFNFRQSFVLSYCSSVLIVIMFHSQTMKLYIMVNPHSAGIDCRRQNLTSVDVRLLKSKVDPCTVRVKISLMAVDPYHRYSIEAEGAE